MNDLGGPLYREYRVTKELFRDNGKENGNYRDYRDYLGIIGLQRGYIGIMENKTEWFRV